MLPLLLSGCGNGDDGITRRRLASQSSLTAKKTFATPLDSFSSCQPMVVKEGTNPAYANATYSGIQACRGLSRPAEVLLQVNAYFPTNVTFCLIPINSAAAPESCFTINGQAQIALSTSNYSYLVLVANSDLAAYKAYQAQLANDAPPRAIATMPTP
jgi:hypothetical protein